MNTHSLTTLRSYDRVKFVGDWEVVKSCLKEKLKDDAKPLVRNKVYTVNSMSDYQNTWYVSFYGPNMPNLHVKDIDKFAEQFEIEELRHDKIEIQRRTKLGVRFAQMTLTKFQGELEMMLNGFKSQFHGHLDGIETSEKLLLLANLKPLDKLTVELLYEYENIQTLIETWSRGKANGRETQST